MLRLIAPVAALALVAAPALATPRPAGHVAGHPKKTKVTRTAARTTTTATAAH